MSEISDVPGLNLLSFDGGGITGLSSLLIVREVMSRLQVRTKASKRPDPWEHFDLIAGTGTGAICAAMLGRLRMSVDDAITAYSRLASNVYCDKKLIVNEGSGAFRATKLEEELKEIVEKVTGNPDENMMEEKPNEANCKVVVYAMSAHNLNAAMPCAFRSYPANANAMPDCPIWKALRASTAHPDLFKSVEITELGIGQHYVSGGLGCSNPTAQLLKEAAALYPDRSVASIVSIGTGHAKTIRIPRPSLVGRILSTGSMVASQALRTAHKLAMDNERVAEEMAGRFLRAGGIYYRLNVDQGLQSIKPSEWERQNEISSHTRAYMGKEDTNSMMNSLVEAIYNRLAVVSATQTDGSVALSSEPVSTAISHCPPPTPLFTGRVTEVDTVNRYFRNQSQAQQAFVLYGLGGAGKTQTALKAAEVMAPRYEGVLFVDGSSRDNIETALSGFAVSKGIGSTYMDTLTWLGARRARWLLLFDNVDDPSIPVHEYFPRSGRYSVLITTRHQDIVRLARGRGSHYNLSELNPDEARQLLFEAAGLREDGLDKTDLMATTQLMEDFGYLALAIVQCGAYIWRTKCSISQYRTMYLAERRETLEGDGSRTLELLGYERSVYTTWALSYTKVGILSKKLLGLSAFLQRDTISEEIFRRSSINAPNYHPEVPPAEREAKLRQEVQATLGSFVDDKGQWSSRLFLSAMSELVCLSLVTLNPSSNLYRIHPLVQQWAREIAPDPKRDAEQTALLLALAIDREKRTEDHAFRRAVLPHVKEVMESCQTTNSNNAWRFIAAYDEVGNLDKVEELEFQVLETRVALLGPEHPDTLEIKRYVAGTHLARGRLNEAEAVSLHVLDTRRRILGTEHRDTLKSMVHLASTYDAQKRFNEAETLKLEALDAQKRALGHDDLDTLRCMTSLATTYRDQGQLVKAENLLVEVLAARKRTMGTDHPDTLNCMTALAATHHEQGRLTEAEALHLEVLAVHKRTLGADNRLTLLSTANLAAAYYQQKRLREAEELYKSILPTQKRVLGEDHKDTLQVMHNLAQTYRAQGRRAEYQALRLELKAINSKQ